MCPWGTSCLRPSPTLRSKPRAEDTTSFSGGDLSKEEKGSWSGHPTQQVAAAWGVERMLITGSGDSGILAFAFL